MFCVDIAIDELLLLDKNKDQEIIILEFLHLPPLGLGDVLFFPWASVCLSVTLMSAL